MAASTASSPAPTTDINVPWGQVERFVSLLTHDVRNGLNAVELQMTLLGEISDDPSVKEEAKRVRASVADLTRQLHAVRLATGAPTPHQFVYPAADFMEDLRERFERQHPDSAARVRWNIAPGARSLSIDPDLSMSALIELMENALFFAESESAVEVCSNDGADGVNVTIRQSCAVPPSSPTDDWGRTPLSSSRRDGYGLGVFRAWRILKTQEGTLQFAYSEADRSMVTTVLLPVATTEAAAN